MALVVTRLKGTIKQAYINCRNSAGDEDQALDNFCQELAQAIVDEVKQLTVSYTSGLTAPNGPVVGTLNHTVL